MCGIRSGLVLAALGFIATSAGAQSTPPNFLEEFEGQLGASASKLVALAEAMPSETYTWSPGEGVASVARVFMHVASYNYMYPDLNLGIPAPMGREEYGRWEADVRDKDQVLEILRASMEHVRGVAGQMTADQLDRTTQLYGRDVGEWAVLFQLIAHMNEHLGQSIAYARMNSVVPPWSR
ncbi:MAG: DinB family protein [Vicinamibacterales bacterium]|jgi:uncharacterized damage-inducible protein DinB|nr:hypothetical protein [Acidobacteriota bacterium]MDP6373299.1 DinB family protein [Vicinamibacterales bacterium]MDP6608416.1 DinB family protein [Vicinamibacterales bacterium]HAK56417.1 hypothetical protein [Acidobacteriota bacterium]|tara:strand:+ start:2675 stop:3214 length:540 start_codon:yes stop_codon:yes gene_type:complete